MYTNILKKNVYVKDWETNQKAYINLTVDRHLHMEVHWIPYHNTIIHKQKEK